MLSPSQRNRLYDIKADLFVLADLGKLNLADSTMEFIQHYLDEVLNNDDGQTAYSLIGLWNNKTTVEFINFILNKHLIIET